MLCHEQTQNYSQFLNIRIDRQCILWLVFAAHFIYYEKWIRNKIWERKRKIHTAYKTNYPSHEYCDVIVWVKIKNKKKFAYYFDIGLKARNKWKFNLKSIKLSAFWILIDNLI